MEEDRRVFVVDSQTRLGELPGCLKVSITGKGAAQVVLTGRQQSAESSVLVKVFSDSECRQALPAQLEWGVGKTPEEKSIRTPLEQAQSFQASAIGRREITRIR